MPPPNSFPRVGSSFEEVWESSDMFGTGVCAPPPAENVRSLSLVGCPLYRPLPPGGGSPESVQKMFGQGSELRGGEGSLTRLNGS